MVLRHHKAISWQGHDFGKKRKSWKKNDRNNKKWETNKKEIDTIK